ncbi:MAG TPA: ATP synthase subunit I [Candidatus Sulfopaludibacter sp.]|jgi:hypothetical protein|nr:ATP synthase subunit I [Candidatus Sulfopaludibacter sp.]
MPGLDPAAAIARIRKLIGVLGLGGTLLALVWGSWRAGGGFGMGAAISWLNFRWLHQIVDALGSGRGRKRLAVIAGLRYLLLGGAAYVILRFSKISGPAALCGLFVTAVAVIVEIIIELKYART